jgi:hypothetical protein
VIWLLACATDVEPEPRNPDAGALDTLGEPMAVGDLVVSAQGEDAVLSVTFTFGPLAETADEPRVYVFPLQMASWGDVTLTVGDRIYAGIDGRVILEVTPADPPVVDVFVEGAVLMGDDGAIAIPQLSWVAVPVE